MGEAVKQDAWQLFLESPTFYGFGSASVPPFSWGIHRKDVEGGAITAEHVFRRMLSEWEIPPQATAHFIGAADRAFRSALEIIPPAVLNALEKPGYMRETMIPGVGNLFSNDPDETERPFILRMDMFRILLGKFGLVDVPGVKAQRAYEEGHVYKCLRAVAAGWIFHEIGHLLADNGWIRLDPCAADGAASDFYGVKLRIADSNYAWLGGNTAELKRAIDGVGTDIRVERFGREMLHDDMDLYFHYVYTIGLYAFDCERVFDTALARHRLMLTLLYETGLELAHAHGNAFGMGHHDRFVARRDEFLRGDPFQQFDELREIMRIYRDRTELRMPEKPGIAGPQERRHVSA